MRKERFEAFTDGVVAIIITLMILEIQLPELTAGNILLLLRNVFIYALSFVVIAIVWINHHNMFPGVEKVGRKIIWINFSLLFFMSLIPLATKSLGEHFMQKESHMLYGAILTGTAITYTLLQWTVNLSPMAAGRKYRKRTNRINLAACLLYASTIPLSFISVYLPAAIFILLPVIYFIPSGFVVMEA